MPIIYSQGNPYDQVVRDFVQTYQRNEEERRIRHEQESQQRRRRNIGIGLGVAGAAVGGFAAAGAAGGLSGLQGAAIGGQIGYGVGDAAGAGDYGAAAVRGLQGYAQVQAIPQLQAQGVSNAEIASTALSGGNLGGILQEQRQREARSRDIFARSVGFQSGGHLQDAAAQQGMDVPSFVGAMQQQAQQAEVRQKGAIAQAQTEARLMANGYEAKFTPDRLRQIAQLNQQKGQMLQSDMLRPEQKAEQAAMFDREISLIGPELVPKPPPPKSITDLYDRGELLDTPIGTLGFDRSGAPRVVADPPGGDEQKQRDAYEKSFYRAESSLKGGASLEPPSTKAVLRKRAEVDTAYQLESGQAQARADELRSLYPPAPPDAQGQPQAAPGPQLQQQPPNPLQAAARDLASISASQANPDDPSKWTKDARDAAKPAAEAIGAQLVQKQQAVGLTEAEVEQLKFLIEIVEN